MHGLDAEARGWLELPRELPGFFIMLVAGLMLTVLRESQMAALAMLFVTRPLEGTLLAGGLGVAFIVGLCRRRRVLPLVALFALFVAFVSGGLVAGVLMATGRRRRGETIALGPFLVLGGATVLLYGDELLATFYRLATT